MKLRFPATILEKALDFPYFWPSEVVGNPEIYHIYIHYFICRIWPQVIKSQFSIGGSEIGGDPQIYENRRICRRILLVPAAIIKKPGIFRFSSHRSNWQGGNFEIYPRPKVNGPFYKQKPQISFGDAEIAGDPHRIEYVPSSLLETCKSTKNRRIYRQTFIFPVASLIKLTRGLI